MPSSSAGPRVTGRHARRVRWLLGGVVFLVHSLSPIPQSGDSRLSAATGWAFLHHFDLDLSRYPGITSLPGQGDLVGANGHLLPFFPWPPMLLSIPADVLVWLFSPVSPASGLPLDFLPGHTFLVEVPTASLLVAVTTVLLRELLLGLPGRPVSDRAAMLTALLFAFGTSAWSVGSRALWQQTVSMLLITVSLLVLQRISTSGRAPLLLGAVVALAVTVRPTNAVFALLVLVLVLWRHRPVLWRVVLGGLAVGIVFLAYSRWQYGQFLPPYYEPSRFGDPPRYGFGQSLLVNLVSPSRGLLFFDPVVVLAVVAVVRTIRRRRLTPTDALMVASVIGQLLVIGKYGSTGGFTYGPRLMIDVLPMLMVLAAPTLTVFDPRAGDVPHRAARRFLRPGVAALTLVIVWSVFVNGSGAISRAGVCWNQDPVSVDISPSRVWDLSDPQFLRPVRSLLSGAGLDQVVLGYCRTGTGATGGTGGAGGAAG